MAVVAVSGLSGSGSAGFRAAGGDFSGLFFVVCRRVRQLALAKTIVLIKRRRLDSTNGRYTSPGAACRRGACTSGY